MLLENLLECVNEIRGVNMRRFVLIAGLAIVAAAVGCRFSEFAQSAYVIENIDDYRTGCEVDTATLMKEYKQHEANRMALRRR